MPALIDISVRLAPGMATWPNSVVIRVQRTQSFAAGDDVNVSRLDMDVHCGTHVESALHFNLAAVDAGEYRLICLPIWLGDAEAAPARAVLEALP